MASAGDAKEPPPDADLLADNGKLQLISGENVYTASKEGLPPALPVDEPTVGSRINLSVVEPLCPASADLESQSVLDKNDAATSNKEEERSDVSAEEAKNKEVFDDAKEPVGTNTPKPAGDEAAAGERPTRSDQSFDVLERVLEALTDDSPEHLHMSALDMLSTDFETKMEKPLNAQDAAGSLADSDASFTSKQPKKRPRQSNNLLPEFGKPTKLESGDRREDWWEAWFSGLLEDDQVAVTAQDTSNEAKKEGSGWPKRPGDWRKEWLDLDESKAPLAAALDDKIVKRCGKGVRRLFIKLVPTKADFREKQQLQDDLEGLFNKIRWLRPCTVALFGSWVSLLGTKDSDMDLCLLVGGPPTRQREQQRLLMRVSSILTSHGYDNVTPIPRASVPIIKFNEPHSGTDMDICINFEERFTLGIYGSRLMRAYAKFDSVVRPLALVIKHWSKCRGINNAHQGFLSSHGLVLMLLYWLQQECGPQGAVVPDLQAIVDKRSKVVGGCDIRFCSSIETARSIFGKPEVSGSRKLSGGLVLPTDDAILFDLLAGFFYFYAQKFDTRKDIVRLHPGRGGNRTCGVCNRELNISWFPNDSLQFYSFPECKDCASFGRHRHPRPYRPLAIEDPIDASRDVAAVLGRDGQNRVFQEFDRAWRVLLTSGSVTLLCEPAS